MTPFPADLRQQPYTEDGSVLFLVDEAAQPVVKGSLIAPRPIRYFPLSTDERLIRYVEELRQKEEQECRDIYGGLE